MKRNLLKLPSVLLLHVCFGTKVINCFRHVSCKHNSSNFHIPGNRNRLKRAYLTEPDSEITIYWSVCVFIQLLMSLDIWQAMHCVNCWSVQKIKANEIPKKKRPSAVCNITIGGFSMPQIVSNLRTFNGFLQAFMTKFTLYFWFDWHH